MKIIRTVTADHIYYPVFSLLAFVLFIGFLVMFVGALWLACVVSRVSEIEDVTRRRSGATRMVPPTNEIVRIMLNVSDRGWVGRKVRPTLAESAVNA